MILDVETLVQWLPNSDQYDTEPGSDDYALLHQVLTVTISHVSDTCVWLGDPDFDPEDGSQPPSDQWPVTVQQAVLHLAADELAQRNRPGSLEYGQYVPRDYAAEKLLARYLRIEMA